MYEKYDYDTLLDEMKEYVIQECSTVDTREGSIIHDALAPFAVELMSLYMEMNGIMTDTFADTASRDYLILRCKERGITPEEATCAVLRGKFTPSDVDVLGCRFSLEDLNYVVTEKIYDGVYRVQCETAGIVGNQYFGSLIPVDYIEGLETAELVELLIPGEDEEDTEALRERYFASFSTKSFGGNKKDYLEMTNSIQGVGATKVTPIWNGGGTVLLTIIDSNFDRASDTLVSTVKQEIDPEPYGTGEGLAPIGHVVTVQTVEEVPVNVEAAIELDSLHTFAMIENTIISGIEDYLLSLRKSWADTDELVVRTARIETMILDIEGVVDVVGLTINGSTNNLICTEYQIPVFGSVINDG